MQVLPSLWEGLHLAWCLAHKEPSINGEIVVIPIKKHTRPLWLLWPGVPELVRVAPSAVTHPAGGGSQGRQPGRGPVLQAPHGQGILKALY